MNKKALLLFLLGSSMMYANDTEDFVYINKLNEQGDVESSKMAITESNNFLKKFPDSRLGDAVLRILAFNYFATGDYENALATYGKLLNGNFKNDASFYIMQIHIKKGEFETAEQELKTLDIKNNYKLKATYALAEAFYNKDKLDKAEEYYKLMLKESGEYYLDSMLKLGLIYYKKADLISEKEKSSARTSEYIKAVAILESYIYENRGRENKKMPLVLYIAGYANEQCGEFNEAAKYYEEILIKYKESEYYYEALYNLAKHYTKEKDADKVEYYTKLLKDSKYAGEVGLLLSDLYYQMGNLKKSEEVFKTISSDRNDETLIYRMVSVSMKLGNYDNALENLQKIKDTEKYRDEYFYYSFYILYSQNKFKEILELTNDYEKAISLKNTYKDDIELFIAEANYSAGNYENSQAYYEKILKDEKTSEKNRKKAIYRLMLIFDVTKKVDAQNKIFAEYKKNYEADTEYRRDMYILAAKSYVAREKYDGAEKVYKEFLSKENDDTITRNLVAVLLKQEKYGEMENYLRKFSDSSENSYMLGVAYMGTSNFERAIIVLKKIVNSKDDEYKEEAYLNLTEAYYNLKMYEEVINSSDDYLERGYAKYKTKIIIKKAMAFFKQKKYDEAVSIYNELIKNSEMVDYAYFMIAEVAYNQGNYEKAEEKYQYIVDTFKDSSYRKNSLYWLTNIAYEKQDYDKALSYITTMLKSYKENEYLEEILYFAGNIYLAKNKFFDAIKQYEKVISITSKKDLKENVISKVITIYFNQASYKEALSWTDKLDDGSYKKLWYGLIFEKTGKENEAIKNYLEASNDSENGDKANFYLASLYLSRKQTEKARTYFNKVLDFSTSEYKDDSLFKIAVTYEMDGSYQSAIKTLMRIKLVYDSSELQDIVTLKIAQNYEKIKEFDQALNAYSEFYTKYKTSEYYLAVLERLVAYYINRNDLTTAEKFYFELNEKNREAAETYKKYFKQK